MTGKLIAALAAAAVGTAAQAGVLTYSGYLQDASGQPVTTATTITFRFYPAAAGGTAVWQDVVTVLPGSDGWFSAVIGGTALNPLDAADFAQPLWLGLQVSTDAQEMAPRTQIGTAPYALTVSWTGVVDKPAAFPSDWTSVSGKPATFPTDPATTQARIGGTCAPGSALGSVAEDGSVGCNAFPAYSVVPGSGLTQSGTAFGVDTAILQRRVSGTCAANTFVTGVGPTGTVTCASDSTGRVVVTGQTTTATGFQQDLTLTCPAGLVPYGAGVLLRAANNSTNVDGIVSDSHPTANGWSFHAHEVASMSPLGYAWRIEGWVICAR